MLYYINMYTYHIIYIIYTVIFIIYFFIDIIQCIILSYELYMILIYINEIKNKY